VKRSRSSNKECSIARAIDVVGDRWSILLLREAYYGTRRFDGFLYYLGVAPNILSARLKKFVDLGIMTRVPLPEHSGRYEYVLTEKGRDFFPTYLALKKWGDDQRTAANVALANLSLSRADALYSEISAPERRLPRTLSAFWPATRGASYVMQQRRNNFDDSGEC